MTSFKGQIFEKPVQKSISAAQTFRFRGDKYIIKKVRVVSLTRNMPTGSYLCLYQILPKYFKPLWSYAQEFGLEIHSGEITWKKNIKILSFLHVTLLTDLIYVPTKYYQIISNSMGVMACTRFWFQGREKQELSFLHATFLLGLIYVPTKNYQIISNSMGVIACKRFRLQGR